MKDFYRQKQTPRGNNPPKKMLRKCEAKTTGEHPYGRVIPTELHTQLYWNYTPASALPRKLAPLSQNTLSKNISGRQPLYWYLISKLNFVKRNLLKVKSSWDHWYLVIFLRLWLLTTFVYINWQNSLVSEKRISLYSL